MYVDGTTQPQIDTINGGLKECTYPLLRALYSHNEGLGNEAEAHTPPESQEELPQSSGKSSLGSRCCDESKNCRIAVGERLRSIGLLHSIGKSLKQVDAVLGAK